MWFNKSQVRYNNPEQNSKMQRIKAFIHQDAKYLGYQKLVNEPEKLKKRKAPPPPPPPKVPKRTTSLPSVKQSKLKAFFLNDPRYLGYQQLGKVPQSRKNKRKAPPIPMHGYKQQPNVFRNWQKL